MALGRQRQIGRNQNAVSFRNKERTLGPVSNTIILIVLACMLGLLYLTQVTKTNAYGYQIDDLQKQQSQLASDNEDLQVASARLQSLDRVQNSSTAKNMTAVAPTGSVRN
jgi:hypothetical protein